MEGFLRVDSGSNLPGSSSSFMTDNADATSICPLITPSPPTNALVDPLPESIEPNYIIGQELAQKLQQVHNKSDPDASISSTSSSSEPACTQLLDHGSSYLDIPSNEEARTESPMSKTTPMELTFRNPAEDYFFMSWNWPLIRKISLYVYLSGLVAMLGLVIAMISTLPKTCNPPTHWYQGHLFYEIFPPSFYSSNQRMNGDLKGISMKSDYIMNLGVRAVRLNSIFTSPHYPEDFENITTLMEIAQSLGGIEDFKNMVRDIKSRNMSLILDLPVSTFIQRRHLKKLPITGTVHKNNSDPVSEFSRISDTFEPVEEAIHFWALHGVDGFYLKGVENHAEDPNTAHLIKKWKHFLGPERILIVSEELINLTPKETINLVLNNVDLVDVKVDIEKGVPEITKQIKSIQNGSLFSKPGMPWVHWSLGNVYSKRLANVLPFANATLGATILQMMLPGTPSIFYGDEIGLHQISDPMDERKDIKHLHQLTMMPWQNEIPKVLSWISGDDAVGNFEQISVISKMANLRSQSPSIYMNAVYKEDDNKANAEVKYTEKDFLVIQRWYPRRKAYVVASNLGAEKISADLSMVLYTGQVIVGPKADSHSETISFKEVNLWPGESVVIVLD